MGKAKRNRATKPDQALDLQTTDIDVNSQSKTKQDTDMCTKKDIVETKKCSLSSRYLWIAIISIAIFIIFQCFSHWVLKKSQQEIVDSYREHIVKADQCVQNFKQYALDNMVGVQDISSRIAVDSLIKASVGKGKPLSRSQHKVLINTINTHFSALDRVRNEYEVKFLKDSLLLSVERTLLGGQTKNMIDIHLDKIEHEYSNITMWAAILTLVFLVFSFYSMFKLEEYIRQGKETVDEIKNLKSKSKKSVDDITNQHKDILKAATDNFNAKTDIVIQNYNDKLSTEVVKLETISSSEIDKYSKTLNGKFKVLEERIDVRYINLETKTKQLELIIKTYQEAVEQVNKSEQMSNKNE